MGILPANAMRHPKIGEVIDTVADRIIENTFWIYFTTTGLIPL